MNLERSFRLSSLLLLTSGYIGLIFAAHIPVELALLGFAALTVSVIQASGWGLDRWVAYLSNLSTETWNALMVVAFVACGADLIWMSQDMLLAGINFLIVLMVNKLFNLRQRKDFLYLYAISLLQILATASLTVEPWYAFIFIAYLLAAIWTLLLYHLRNEAEEIQKLSGGSTPPSPSPITARFFWSTNGVALTALCLTVAIFYVTPRAGAGFFQTTRTQPIRTSGFSQTVDLGVIGSVKLDPTLVMRVELPDQVGPAEERMYLQGATFDYYNGRSWVNTFTRRRMVRRAPNGGFLVSREPRGRSARPTIRQEILIEALDTPALFGMPAVQNIKGNFFLLQTDGMGGLHLPFPPMRRFQYSVQSIPTQVNPEERKVPSFRYPDHIQRRFLQLPNVSPRVGKLAREVTRKAGTPYEQAVAVKWHLVGGYRYSLDVGNLVPRSPIEDFLFVRKTGYCEHYATAMVLMLRTVGVPARLVTGFLAAEWNDFGNFYTVRQQDAHAWVEVFFPKSGWVIFDPTPSPTAATPTSVGPIIGRFVDSLRLKWTRLIIQYSFSDQQAVLQEIRERSEPVRTQAWSSLTTALKVIGNWREWFLSQARTWDKQFFIAWLASVGLSVFFLLLLKRSKGWTWRKRGSPHSPQQLAATKMYGQMLHLLEARGLRKAAHSAPLEFAGTVIAKWVESAPLVNPLTHLYCRARFGTNPLSQEDTQWANHLLSKLRALKRKKEISEPTSLGGGKGTAPHGVKEDRVSPSK